MVLPSPLSFRDTSVCLTHELTVYCLALSCKESVQRSVLDLSLNAGSVTAEPLYLSEPQRSLP